MTWGKQIKTFAQRMSVIAIYCLLTSIASASIAPSWSKDFRTPVQWQKVTPSGILLVCTSDALSGIDPDNGKELWSHQTMRNLSITNYTAIAGTPFSEIQLQDKFVIFEPFGGKIIFHSGESELEEISSKKLIANNGVLMVSGTGKARDPKLLCISLLDGTTLWSKNDEFAQFTGAQSLSATELLITSSKSIAKLNSISGEEVWKAELNPVSKTELAEQEAIRLAAEAKAKAKADKQAAKDAARIAKGKKPRRWTTKLLNAVTLPESTPKTASDAARGYLAGAKTKFIFPPNSKTIVFVGFEHGDKSKGYYSVRNGYMPYSLKTGKALWDNPVITKGELSHVVFDARGLLIFPRVGKSSSAINLLDYKTGKSVWGTERGIFASGAVLSYKLTKYGYLITTASSHTSEGKTTVNYSMNILNPKTGKMQLERSVGVRGNLLHAEVTPASGIFYVTTSEINIVNPKSGKSMIGGAIPTQRGLFSSKGNHYFVMNNEDYSLHMLDKKSGKCIRIIKPNGVEFQAKETPNLIEIRGNSLVISSSQNIAKINFAPKPGVAFNKYHPAPKKSGLRKALLLADAAYAAAYSAQFAEFTYEAGQATKDTSEEDVFAKGMGEAFTELGATATVACADYSVQCAKAAFSRSKATKASKDYLFMMTNLSKREYGLAQVDKNTGNIKAKISFGKDDEPSYDVDNVTGKIFYRNSPKKVTCYSF